MKPGNIFAALPADLKAEMFDVLLSAEHLRLERIVSQPAPWDFWELFWSSSQVLRKSAFLHYCHLSWRSILPCSCW